MCQAVSFRIYSAADTGPLTGRGMKEQKNRKTGEAKGKAKGRTVYNSHSLRSLLFGNRDNEEQPGNV